MCLSGEELFELEWIGDVDRASARGSIIGSHDFIDRGDAIRYPRHFGGRAFGDRHTGNQVGGDSARIRGCYGLLSIFARKLERDAPRGVTACLDRLGRGSRRREIHAFRARSLPADAPR